MPCCRRQQGVLRPQPTIGEIVHTERAKLIEIGQYVRSALLVDIALQLHPKSVKQLSAKICILFQSRAHVV
jgi:hypothetical protein